jgi:trk system potassium uptake protein TrkA
MNVIVIGMGEVGKQTAFMLAIENYNIVIIDDNNETLQTSEDKMDVMALGGHGASPRILKEAQVDKADLVIAVTNNDETNLLSALIARQLGAKQTVARISNKQFLPDRKGYNRNYFGIDLVISPSILTAKEIVRFIRSSSTLHTQDFAENKVQLINIRINHQNPLLEKTLADIPLPEQVTIAGISRENDFIYPDKNEAIEENDTLFFVGIPKQLLKVEKVFELEKGLKNKRVMLVGANEISLEIAEELETMDIECIIIDSDKKKCDLYADKLDKTEVVCGDATDPSFLREENINNVDIFIGLTQRDEINLMATLLAKRDGVKKTFALTQQSDYQKIFNQLGVDSSASPRLIAAEHILRFIKRGQVVNSATLIENKALLIELVVHRDSRINKKTLSELNIPYGAFVVMIKRDGGEVVQPYLSFQFEENDRVLFVTKLEIQKSVERLFKRKGLII